MYFISLIPVLLALQTLSIFGAGSNELNRRTNLSYGPQYEYSIRSLNNIADISNASKPEKLLKDPKVSRRLRRDAEYQETEPLEGATSRDKREGIQSIDIHIEAEDLEPDTYNFETEGAAAPPGAEVNEEEGESYPLNRAEGLLDVHVRPMDAAAAASSKRDVQVFVDAGPGDVLDGVEYEDSERQDFSSRTKRLTPTHKDEAPPLTDTVPWMQEPSSGGQRDRPSQTDQGPHQVVEIGSAVQKFQVKVPLKTSGQGHQSTGHQRPPNGGRPQLVQQGTHGHTHKIQVQVKPYHRPQTQTSGVVSSGGHVRNPQQQQVRPRPQANQTPPPRKPIIVPQQRPPPRPPMRVPQRPKAPLQGPPHPKIYMPQPQPHLSEGGSEVKIIVDEVPDEGSLDGTSDTHETPLLPQYSDQVPLVPETPGGPSTSFIDDYDTYPMVPDQAYPLGTPDYAQPQGPQQPLVEYPQYPSYDYKDVPPGQAPPQVYPDYQLPSKPNFHPKPSGSKLACNAEYDWGCYSASNTLDFSSYFIISLFQLLFFI